MAKIKSATTTAGRISRETLGSTVGKAASTAAPPSTATTQTLESLRRSVSASSQGTSQGSSKPSQYGGGQEAARQQARERMATRRRGGSRTDDVLREEFTRVQEAIEEEIEEREDILGASGGSSDDTIVVGDDSDEEIQVIGSIQIYARISDSAISDGYIQFLGLTPIGLNRPANANEAQYVENNEAINGFIAFRTLRVTTGSPPDTSTIRDFYFLTSMPTPSLDMSTKKYSYSPEEETFVNSRLATGEREALGIDGITNAIESFFQINETARFEGSIVTNRFESTKKIKLSAFPPDAPVLPPIEPTTSTGSSTTTSGGSSTTTSAGSSY
tara:strand:- start:1634 stop:2623 length:990 start_codon:yes stop_codon:yes gene_type:complete